jgi:hypothetical protein
MKLFIVVFLSSVSLNAFSAANLCAKNPIVEKMDFKNLSRHIASRPVKNDTFIDAQIKMGQRIATKENEFATVVFAKPYKVEFQVYPESEIKILSKDSPCPQIKVIKGKVLSIGNHPAVNTCEFEVETEEAYIQPTGTSYLIETGALSDAIAELNGEDGSGGNNLVGVGQTGTIELGSHERYSVKKGTIQIKLKRVSKDKKQNKIKYAKASNSKKNKSKTRFLAYNEKIKLKAGSSLSVKRKKSSKKTQTADLVVIDPYSN